MKHGKAFQDQLVQHRRRELASRAKAAGFQDGYATTRVIVNGVVYLQDLESNVMAISLVSGKLPETVR